MDCPICREEVKNWEDHIKTEGHQNLLKHRIYVEDAQPIGERHGFVLSDKGITRTVDKEVRNK